jgi:hypothetical protein
LINDGIPNQDTTTPSVYNFGGFKPKASENFIVIF